MKKYLIFIGSFILLYLVYQLGSGLLLTLSYTPDISFSGGISTQAVSFGNRSFHLWVIVLIASIAYFLSQLLKTQKS